MINIEKHLALLGLRVEDRVTNHSGIVTSVTFDLYGCIQAIVNPGIGTDGKPGEMAWYDVNRLKVLDTNPVMDRPDFDWSPQAISEGLKGPGERPSVMKP